MCKPMLWREGSKLRPRLTDRGAGGNIFAEIRVPSKETGFTLLQDFSSQAGDLLRHRLVIRKFQGRALEYRQAAGCRVPCIWGRWFQFLFWRRFWDRIQQLTREGLRFVNLHGNASIHSSFLRSPPTDGPRGWSRALLSGIHLGPLRPPSPSPGPGKWWSRLSSRKWMLYANLYGEEASAQQSPRGAVNQPLRTDFTS